MAFREKVAWTSLISVLLVWGWYFATLVMGLASGGEEFGSVAVRFMIAVVLLVVIHVGGAIVLAVLTPREAEAPPDIREQGFALIAYRNAYFTLVPLIVTIMLAAPLIVHVGPALLRGDPGSVTAILIGNAVLFALVAAELVQSATLIVRFRHG